MATNWHAVFARVRAALRRRGRSEQDADDLVQEAWIRLACYEGDEPVAKPEAFLMHAALNLSIDAHRTRVNHGEQVAVDDVVMVDTAPSVEAVVLARERMARMVLCIGRLNGKTRTIFLAHRIEGMTYRQIASAQGLSVSAVEKHVAKAVLQITGWMEGW